MDYEAYMKFLLQHHDQLKLPYPFAMKLSFMSSPLEFGKAMLILSEEPYEFVGAVGVVYGTGANDYEDRHICQIEIAFIREQFRRTSLFLRGLEALIRMIKASNSDVEQIQFWASADNEELERLVSRWSSLPGYSRSIVNNLAFYTIPFAELEAYCGRFGSGISKE
ncbi:hypothetical protein [Paenibacillus planticolens]|uniref:N-acetyltransferase domain-containing protein n=1 Tax=Paenibacillus planticolens TaxID=2654976 RepID=A0ABX1ZLX7_9BACL|nr:hypothetical protein [Paenibacillus planticolens]NOV01067.1 hypothetical protein [Paenibacillus planticolens]